MADVNITSRDIPRDKLNLDALRALKQSFPQEDDNTLARFLLARNNNIDQATEMFTNHLQWRRDNLPVFKADCMEELSKKKALVHGFDKEGHPVIYFRAKYNDPWARNLDDALRAFIWCLEVAIARMGPEVSKVCIVIDRNGFTQKNVDFELARAVSKVLSANYPERLYRCIVHPAGMVYYSLWNTVKWFFDPATREKVVPLMYQSALQDYIAPDLLVASLGGEADIDVEPDTLPDDPYTPAMIEELSEESKVEHTKRPLYTQTSSMEIPDVSTLDLRDDADVSAEELERAAAAAENA